MEAEIWKPVSKFEDYYEVSDLGRVKSIARGKRRVPNSILKPDHTRTGYLRVPLFKDKTRTRILLHVLVAREFVRNPENKPQVNHRNGIKIDCRARNLEWATASENTTHAYRLGLIKSGDKHPLARLSEVKFRQIRKLQTSHTQRQLARMFGVSHSAIYSLLKGETWKHV